MKAKYFLSKNLKTKNKLDMNKFSASEQLSGSVSMFPGSYVPWCLKLKGNKVNRALGELVLTT